MSTGRPTRDELLRAALHEALTGAPAERSEANRERRRHVGKAWLAEALEFVRAIVRTAALIEQARTTNGELVFRTDAQFALLRARRTRARRHSAPADAGSKEMDALAKERS
jgi:hypothetical protein